MRTWPACTMAAGSILASLTFAQFLAEDSGGATTEGRQGGIPRYNGDVTRLNEWIFRTRMLAQKEKSMAETEQKKLGNLALRLVEGLSGQALKIAQQLDLGKLEDTSKGVEYLIDSSKPEPSKVASCLVNMANRCPNMC